MQMTVPCKMMSVFVGTVLLVITITPQQKYVKRRIMLILCPSTY